MVSAEVLAVMGLILERVHFDAVQDGVSVNLQEEHSSSCQQPHNHRTQSGDSRSLLMTASRAFVLVKIAADDLSQL